MPDYESQWHLSSLADAFFYCCGGVAMANFIDKDEFYNYNIIIELPRFEWDENKNAINKLKHNVAFEEAKTVFDDVEALIIDDPDHSQDEERFIILGFSNLANLLVVCHCYRENDAVIRLISARKATKQEAKQYHDSLRR